MTLLPSNMRARVRRAVKNMFSGARLAEPAPAGDVFPAERGLFIIGAARSGTTILQNALNDSPEIYLLGEPELHKDPGAPGFAARFNAGHRYWRNQETKSSFCPPILAHDPSWQDYICQFARYHKWVGAKVVINPIRRPDALDQLFAFHCQSFYLSRYIFTFRDPLATILSTRDLQELLIGRTDGLPAIMRSYVDTVQLFIRMLRTLPHVRAVCHEDVDRGTFDRLEDWLGVRLTDAHLYYDNTRVLSYNEAGLDQVTCGHVAMIRTLYDQLRQELRIGFAIPQLDQNNNHLKPSHFTPLGRLSRQADEVAASLAAPSA
jgi:hypothetical protein